MLIFTSLLAFYLAWNLGANDVANSMGTSVGSKAVTLRQALVIAGILEFTGAVLFGRNVSETLATKIVNPTLFSDRPTVLLVGMVAVLIACGVWLNVATVFGLPVSSSHAVVGAIAGFAWVAVGPGAVDWQSIERISLTWVATPIVSGAIAALFYSAVKRWILDQSDPLAQLQQWIPWLSAALLGVFGVIVLPTLTRPLQVWLSTQVGWSLPAHDLPIAIGAIATLGLSLASWQQLESLTKQKIPSPTERLLARFQVISACFVAFAHGSNDVGNAIAPLAAIAHILRTGSVPLDGFRVPLWILVIGALGIVAGLAVLGKKVIATVGEGIISLQPSGGFCAELATALTVLLASRLGLPVSTSHALVGGVVGIGLVKNARSIQLKTLGPIALAWVVTIPITAGLSALLFTLGCELIVQSV
ncbi:inorganic phosphate transporter [Leptolyngbya sp. FACHB-36]|uniref:inorganic phosphate transporter n=1 Tax=Leptolyngbya sp. FACHB-36 TaxID=2692808 RepID=UPI0016815C8B|nr:inorganic phosphate transporter [Leptolyngbya sp. FACHB-36]MBD2019489.1 inorganic phosphate transporter [Leptolyngbya sp. FACHB-36]